ncbi:hypothetical protein C7S15_4511 [Burkholderia cepacia]|nr:hypothetical protein [Burkholderia cepacia]
MRTVQCRRLRCLVHVDSSSGIEGSRTLGHSPLRRNVGDLNKVHSSKE